MSEIITTLDDSQKGVEELVSNLKGHEYALVRTLEEKGITKEKFVIQLYHAIKRNPKIASCTLESVLGGMLQSVELGLDINSPFNYCFLIPFRNKKAGIMEAQFVLGYTGIVEILYESERVLKVNSQLVYSNDEFEYEEGLDTHLYHKPAIKGNRGERVAAYTAIKLDNGEHIVLVVDKNQIDYIKRFSNNPELYNDDKDPTGNMWKKAPVRNIMKYVPKKFNKKLERAIDVDAKVISFGADGSVDEETPLLPDTAPALDGANWFATPDKKEVLNIDTEKQDSNE